MSSTPYAITQQDSAVFQQKYIELVGSTQEQLSGEKAHSFFLTSGLSAEQLGRIWSLVDQDKRGNISYTQFQIAMTVAKNVLRGNTLPSYIPREVLYPISRPLSPVYPAPLSTAVPMTSQLAAPSYLRTSSPEGAYLPAIDDNTRRKYIQQFNTLDTSRSGFLSGVQVKASMSKSFLPHTTLGKVWELADYDKDGRLSSFEFVLTMHLIECAKQGITLPDKLPHYLLPTAPQTSTLSLSLKHSPSPPQAPLLSDSFLPPQTYASTQQAPAQLQQSLSSVFPMELSKQSEAVSKQWGDIGLGMFSDDSTEPVRRDRKLSLEDMKRENFLRGQQFLQKRKSEQFQQEDRRASEILQKKKSEEKLRVDRERADVERRRTNSIKEIKLDKERELVQIRRQQLEEQRKRLNEELDSLKSQASSLQAEEEHLDMRRVDLESRVWHQEQFTTSLRRELQAEQGREVSVGATQDKTALQTQLKTQTNRLASLVSRKELLKKHLKSRESTQADALKSYDSLSDKVAQYNASIERVRKEKVCLEVSEQIVADDLATVQKQLAGSRQRVQEAKHRVQSLEGSVRKKQREVNAFFANRKRTEVSVDKTQVLAPAAKPVVRQEDFVFDPFDTLDSTGSKNKTAESATNDLVNIFSFVQPVVQKNVIVVPAKPVGEIKVESIYETSANFAGRSPIKNTQEPIPPQKRKQKHKQKQKDKQPQQPIKKEDIHLPSYNMILPDNTISPLARRDSNPPAPSPNYDTYVDSNTLLEYATAKQEQAAKRPVSMFASIDTSSSSSVCSVQDNILYQRSDSLEIRTKPPRPTRYPSNVIPPLSSVPSSTHRLSALYDFESSEEGLLSFKKGDLLSWRPEYDGPDDGWVGAEINGVCGIVPESYVQKLPIRTAPSIPAPYSINNKEQTEQTKQQQQQQTQQVETIPVEDIYAQPQKYLPRSVLGTESDEQTVDAYQVESKVSYKGRTAEQLCFEKGILISVTKEKTQSKWLYGSYGDKSGWFPKFAVNSLDTLPVKSTQLEDNSESSSVAKKPACDIATTLGTILSSKGDKPKSGELHLALYDFNGTQEGDLVFKKHDKILITETIDKWMHGELDGKSGYLPTSYVAKISTPVETEDVTSPIYGNIQAPIAAARGNSAPIAPNKPIKSSTEPTVSKLSIVQEIKSKMEQTNTVYTGYMEINKTADMPLPISKSRSQPSGAQPQAAPRPLIHSQSKQSNSSVSSVGSDTSQEEHSIAPFSTPASMRFKQRGGDFCFQAGDTLHITMSRAGGKWYYGRVESSGLSGWFPCSFIPNRAETAVVPAAAKPRAAEQEQPRESDSAPEIGAYYVALYDYHQAYEEDLSFKKGDNIKLVSVDGEWATGEFNGRQGYFPLKYVEKSQFVADKSNGVKYSAVFSYTAQNDDEITFNRGDVINLISKSTDNWWRGELSGKIGVFPANYVQELREAFKQNDASSIEKELEFVITEIVSSELSYLTDLQLVDELVFQPIEKNRLLTQSQLKQIMVNWRELVAVSRRMVEGMQSDRDLQQSFQVMAGLFHSQVSSLQRFVTWCSNQSGAINLLQKKLETDPSIRELQVMWSQDPRTTHLPISSFMLKPMQRITKYQLFMKRLLELCPVTDTALKSKLETALSQLEQICMQANEGVRMQENASRVEWIMNHLEFAENEVFCKNIIHTRSEISRKLLYTGKLVKTNSNKELVGFLFSDLLLFTRPSKNLFQRHISTSDLFEDEECKLINYRCPYKLSNVVTVKPCVGDECCFLLEAFDSLENQIRSLQLRAENHTNCKNWVKQLEEGMERCRQDRLFDVSSYQDVGSGSLAEALRAEYSFSTVTGDVDLI